MSDRANGRWRSHVSLLSLIDWVLVGVVLLPLRLVGDQVVTEVLSFVIYAAYLITFWAYRGATPGKMALGLRVVRQDGEDVDVSVAALRFVGYMVSGIVLGLGFLWVVCDSNNEGWHDKIAKTRVIHVAR